jgi:hypothetical protein
MSKNSSKQAVTQLLEWLTTRGIKLNRTPSSRFTKNKRK